MRRGQLCALWILVFGCAPGGADDTDAVVTQPGFVTPGTGAGGGGGELPVGVEPGGSGNVFGDDLGCTNGCAFPTAPILDSTDITAAEIAAFVDPENFQGGSLCVLEPQLSTTTAPGAMFPRNWLRPRFRWVSNGGETLWEIRMHTASQPDDLRAYTRFTDPTDPTSHTWSLPADVWARMRDVKEAVQVTIRGVGAGGVLTGVRGDFTIAPVDAGGSMVFWATTSSLVTKTPLSSKLQGFAIRDEGVVEVLNATEVTTGNIPGEDGAAARGFYACGGATPRPTCTGAPTDSASCCTPTGFTFGEVECVGCHVSTPDGKAVLFTDNWPWDKVAASIEPATVGQRPATVTAYASQLLKQPWLGMQALSPKFFATDGQRILVTTYGVRNNPTTKPFDNVPPTKHELAWFDLAADDPLNVIPEQIPPDPQLPGQTQNIYDVANLRNAAVGKARGVSWGPINTIGENRSAVTPTWSNDGDTIAYVSTDVSSTDGHPDWTANEADIHVVPYANHTGGAVTALPGASDPDFLEYYPEFSKDDAFIAFARAPKPTPTANGGRRCVPTQDANGAVTTCPPPAAVENPDGPYYNRNGEIYIVPRNGGTAIRLAANDPVSCSGETARGSINSWPKWSPKTEKADDGKTYYFLIFSSARDYPGAFQLPAARLTPDISHKSSQLYMAPIVVDATGAVTTYPAIYLWNQNILVAADGTPTPEQTSNLTPAWNDFSIPPVPPIVQIPR